VPTAITGDELVLRLTTDGPSMAGLVVVDDLPDAASAPDWPAATQRLATMPCVVVGGAGWGGADSAGLELVDARADDVALQAIAATLALAPLASTALALHLRGVAGRTMGEGLVAESAVYSALQAGPEFAAWRRATPVRLRPPTARPAVAVERKGDQLVVELDRPEVRNALGVQMRDELLNALAVAEADPALQVTLRGRGPSFCAGGDLDEFGRAPDPATAHLIRLDRSIGAVLARLADRVTVELHGACLGSGIELPAFAGRIVAHPDTTFGLPELGLGLIPGAGGTVSLPARIGRHRTALLALTRQPIDAPTALRWGLVDALG